MSNDPETDRQFAYLKLTGDGTPNQVTETLGLVPDESWTKGESFTRGHGTSRRHYSLWRLNSGLLDSAELPDHLNALIARISRRRDELISLQSDWQITFQCVSYQYQSCGLHLPHENLKQLLRYGGALDFDLYSFGDIHEEMMEMRAALQGKPQ